MDTKQQLVNALAGLGSTITEAMDVIEGFVPCGHPALTVSNALVVLDADDDAWNWYYFDNEGKAVTGLHSIDNEQQNH